MTVDELFDDDPAWENWLKGKEERRRIERRRELLKKYRVLIASSAASISMVAAFFVWKIFPLL